MNTLRHFFGALRLYSPGIIFVFLVYILLIKVDQGIDVVLQAGEYTWPGILSLAGTTLFAFLTWYSLRLLSYAYQHYKETPEKYLPTVYHRVFPRFIAFNTFAAVQCAICHVVFLNHPHEALYFWLAFVFYWAIFFLFSANLSGNLNPLLKKVTYSLLVIYIAANIWAIIHFYSQVGISGFERYKFWLPLLSLVLFASQMLVLRWFIIRRRKIDAKVAAGVTVKQTRLQKSLNLNDRFSNAETGYFNLFNIIGAVATLIYLAAIFNLHFANNAGPLAFTVLALGVLVGFFSGVKYFTIRLDFKIGWLIWLLAIIIGTMGDPYEVRLTSETHESFDKRPDLKTYLHNWLEQRSAALDRSPDKRYKVFMVLSNGGASRAGNWVCSVLSGLQDSSVLRNPADPFADHILFMAGASGGSVGNSAYYALLARHKQTPVPSFTEESDAFFSGDFLTFTLGRMLGPDFFRHFFPISSIDDRAATLARTMSGANNRIISQSFGKNVSDIFDYSGKLPVLIINTTRVNDGMPGVISSIQLPQNSQRIDVLKLIESTAEENNEGGNVALSTAAVLSARFPYVSPAGCIRNNYFVDGGYFDNSGAGIILEYVTELASILNDTNDALIQKYRNKLSFNILHLTNSAPGDKEPKRISPLVNDLFAPLLTLGGMQGSSTRVGNGLLEHHFTSLNSNSDSCQFELNLYTPADTLANYPMSWVISDYQLHLMKSRCQQTVRENFHLLH